MNEKEIYSPVLDGMITDGAMRLVEEVVKKYNTKDRYEILEHVCQEVSERYPGDSLEYHLNQMKMSTTKDILYIIDIYLIMVEVEPKTTFIRKKRKSNQYS